MDKLVLKPGREKTVLRRHPWIFSGAVAQLPDTLTMGETVAVTGSDGKFLAWAAYSPKSQIIARIWSWDKEDTIDKRFLFERLRRSIDRRRYLKDNFYGMESDAFRLVYAESDGIPGLVVDKYPGTLVIQILSAGAEYWKDDLVQSLNDLTGIDSVYERSDVDVRKLEGLPERTGILTGSEPLEFIRVVENGLGFRVNIRTGHKTGFYLDQRVNRFEIRKLAQARDVLDCFCYTGGFTCSSAAGNAKSILSVDSSVEALAYTDMNLSDNGLGNGEIELREGDVFSVLRDLRDRGRSFDMIILDPPKFAPTVSNLNKAARGYKDINLLAFKLLRPGGLLATFSCSGGVSAEFFQKIIAGAALDARVEARILKYFSQSPDHPVALNFPEGAYLKGLLIQVRQA